MRDDSLRQTITEQFPSNLGWLKISAVLLTVYALGFGSKAVLDAYSSNGISDDDLAKLVELAACSTGEPASAIWFRAMADQTWYRDYRAEVAKQFLVDIDIHSCSIREAANTHTDQGKIWALSPDDRKN